MKPSKTTPGAPAEPLTEAELSQQLDRWQRMEGFCTVATLLTVVASLVLLLVTKNLILFSVLFFAGIAIAVFPGKHAQTQKRATLNVILGDSYFQSELETAFGPMLDVPELAINEVQLRQISLVDRLWEDCEVRNAYTGVSQGLRFSAANVTLRHTYERFLAREGRMTCTEKMLEGIVIRCETVGRAPAAVRINERVEEHPCGDISDEAAFHARFLVTADPGGADCITPELRALLARLEAATRGSLEGVVWDGSVFSLALNTKYVFADIPEGLDMRDLKAVRSWFTASLRGMTQLLELVQKNAALGGAAE